MMSLDQYLDESSMLGKDMIVALDFTEVIFCLIKKLKIQKLKLFFKRLP